MSETKAKYELVYKHLKGIYVTKYTIKRIEDGEQKDVAIGDVIKLAALGKIANATTIVDITSGENILKIDGGYSALPVKHEVDGKLIARIVDSNNKLVGYRLKGINGKTYKMSADKAWNLAAIGCIDNAEAKIISNKRILRGCNGIHLEDLPKINDNK